MTLLFSYRPKNRSFKMRKFTLFTIVFVPAFIFFLTGLVYADTTVSSNIIIDTIWTKAGSPYLVTQSIDVYPDVNLTIEPGVEVRFSSGSDLEIYGKLIANGTEAEMVTFTSNQTTPLMGDWGGISFKEGAVGTTDDGNGNYVSGSIIKHCDIKYGGGLHNENTEINLFILNNKISNNSHSPGIINYGNSKIEGNTITDNISYYEYGGGVYNSGDSVISYNTINNNTNWGKHVDVSLIEVGGGGIYNSGNSTITNNTIMGNILKENLIGGTSINAYGAGIYNTGDSTISNNTIQDNRITSLDTINQYGGGICNTGNTVIENNTIKNNSIEQGWEKVFGGGIYNSGTATINKNIISGNLAKSPSIHNEELCGGGIYNTGNSTTIINNSITNNIISAGYTRLGAGICNSSDNTLIRDNTITGNTAEGDTRSGGGIYNAGNSISTVVKNNTISDNPINSLSYGGGIISLASIEINGNTISNNGGTGVSNTGNSIITNNIISNNSLKGINNSGDSVITGNKITGNNINGKEYEDFFAYCGGIYNSGFSTIDNNIITNNQSHGVRTTLLNSFYKNDIHSNTDFDFYYVGTTDQIAINNYWGSTNSSVIDAHIYDYWDEITLGKVIYEPYATKPFHIELTKKPMPWIPLLLLDE